jgi:hypothetical protein
MCRKSHEAKNKQPDCEACGLTYLLPENYLVMEIIEKCGSFIGNGFGGIDGASLNSVFDWYRIPAADRLLTALKIESFFKELSKKSKKGE